MIIGSTALKHWYPEFREPKDLDVIEIGASTKQIEKLWIPEFELLLDNSRDKKYLDPDLLLTLKASHANWNIKWEKTMFDILFLKRKGHKINVPIYKKLKRGWVKVHGRESAPLKGVSKEDFFSDAVPRIYDHDSIHEAVAFYNKPLYLKILVGDGTVNCSEKKFNELSFGDKIKLAKEEIYVTALERFIFPNEDFSLGKAYNSSLKKFVTTMSSGWMSFFLIDNFDNLRYDQFNYSKNLKQEKLIKL